MAKGSYFEKHLQRTGEEKQLSARPEPISPGQRSLFEDGQMLLIDKPLHWTSFDVVRKIRNAIGIKKVGHAGTLDPLASGLLIICTGKFTKKINELMVKDKTYTGSFYMGATTPTYDRESNPENFKDISGITVGQLHDTAKAMTGIIQQMPPVYSAIKKQGTPLYELARRGVAVELEPREVHIHTFKITTVLFPEVGFEINCSTGTYIRSIAHDFGQALGCGAYLNALRRESIGEYRVENAVTLQGFLDSLHSNQKG